MTESNDTSQDRRRPYDEWWQIVAIISLVIGALCLFFVPFLPQNSLIFTIVLGLSVSLLPAGLVSIVTSVSSSRVIEDRVKAKLDETAAALESSIGHLRVASVYLQRSKDLGVLMVYPTRSEALGPFLAHVEDYAHKSSDGVSREVVFVGSSLKGVMEDDPKYAAQMTRILEAAKGRCNCRFLLTHPFYSSFREAQEDRPRGAIALEILHAISWLEQHGVPQDHIKLYKGTPTCFMIANIRKDVDQSVSVSARSLSQLLPRA